MTPAASLCCALLALSSASASTPMSWEELERVALDTRGRLESIFEIAQYGTRDQMVSALAADSEALTRRDAQGRSLEDLATLGENTPVLDLLRSTTRSQRSSSPQRSTQAQRSLPLATRAITAIQMNDTAVLKQLIKEGFIVNGYYPFIKASPLEEAIKFGSMGCLRLLVESGANWRVISQREDFGKTMLMVAARYNRAEIIKYLIFLGAHPMSKGGNDATALHDACYYHSLDALRVLLPHYKEVNYSPWGGEKNTYPLSLSMQWQAAGSPQVIEMLRRAGFDPNHSMFAEPPLVTAAKMNKLEAIQALLDIGADPRQRDASGKTAHDYASSEGRALLDAPR